MHSIEQQQGLAQPNNLAKLTNTSVNTVNFSADDFSKIVNNLDPNKAYDYDMFSIQMIKLHGNSICKPPSIIFNDYLKEEKFPSNWNKPHFVPFHKKGDKQCLRNYIHISLITWFLLTSQGLDLVTPGLTK